MTLKQLIKKAVFGVLPKSFELSYYNKRTIMEWGRRGKPCPPPEIVKRLYISKIQREKNLDVFIETGTYLGDMIFAQLKNFKKLYSIELSKELYENAKNRFHGYPHVKILQGDSGIVLKDVLAEVSTRCIFWLDGHYSGVFNGVQTAKGDKGSPISEELSIIFDSGLDHTVLIDDARLFIGRADYPTIDALSEFILSRKPGSIIEIKDDIIFADLKS